MSCGKMVYTQKAVQFSVTLKFTALQTRTANLALTTLAAPAMPSRMHNRAPGPQIASIETASRRPGRRATTLC